MKNLLDISYLELLNERKFTKCITKKRTEKLTICKYIELLRQIQWDT